jgi:hypothetical protein
VHLERALRFLEGTIDATDLELVAASDARVGALSDWLAEIERDAGRPVGELDVASLGKSVDVWIRGLETVRKDAEDVYARCGLEGAERRALNAAEALSRAWLRHRIEEEEKLTPTRNAGVLREAWRQLAAHDDWRKLLAFKPPDTETVRWSRLVEALAEARFLTAESEADHLIEALAALAEAHARAIALCFHEELSASDSGDLGELAANWKRFEDGFAAEAPEDAGERLAAFEGWLRRRYQQSRELLRSLPGQAEGEVSLAAWRDQAERLPDLLARVTPPLAEPPLAEDPVYLAFLLVHDEGLAHAGRRLGIWLDTLPEIWRRDFEARFPRPPWPGAEGEAPAAVPWVELAGADLDDLAWAIDLLWRTGRAAEALAEGLPLGPASPAGWRLWVALESAPAHGTARSWRVELRRPAPTVAETEKMKSERLDTGLRYTLEAPEPSPGVARDALVASLAEALLRGLEKETPRLEEGASWSGLARRLGFDGRLLPATGGFRPGWEGLRFDVLGGCIEISLVDAGADVAAGEPCRKAGVLGEPDLAARLESTVRDLAGAALATHAAEISRRAREAFVAVVGDLRTAAEDALAEVSWPGIRPADLRIVQDAVVWRPDPASLPGALEGSRFEVRLSGLGSSGDPELGVELTPPLEAWLAKLAPGVGLTSRGTAAADGGGWRFDVEIEGLGSLGAGRLDRDGLVVESPEEIRLPGGLALRPEAARWTPGGGFELADAALRIAGRQDGLDGLAVTAARRAEGGWRFALDDAGNERLRAWVEWGLHELGWLGTEVEVRRAAVSSDGLELELSVDDAALRRELEERLAATGWGEAAAGALTGAAALRDAVERSVSEGVEWTAGAICDARDQALEALAGGLGAEPESLSPCDAGHLGPWSFDLRFPASARRRPGSAGSPSIRRAGSTPAEPPSSREA